MSPRQALASALHLFVVLAFFIAGFFFVSLPYLPEVKIQIFEKCTLIGLALFLAALILLLGFYALDRGRYLVIRMGVAADVNVIQQTVEEYFARHFPKKISLTEIEIGRKSRLEIGVSLATLDEGAREKLYCQVEKQLGLLLRERLGYSKEFYLMVRK